MSNKKGKAPVSLQSDVAHWTQHAEIEYFIRKETSLQLSMEQCVLKHHASGRNLVQCVLDKMDTVKDQLSAARDNIVWEHIAVPALTVKQASDAATSAPEQGTS